MGRLNKPFGMVVGQMMNEMFRVLKKRAEEQSEIKITVEQFGLLYAINEEEQDVIQKKMAEIMCKDSSAILRMIDLLEEKDLVRRVVDRNDRRKNYIMVSKRGEKAIEQHLKIASELTRELMDGLSQEELETFFKVIEHIRGKAEKLRING